MARDRFGVMFDEPNLFECSLSAHNMQSLDVCAKEIMVFVGSNCCYGFESTVFVQWNAFVAYFLMPEVDACRGREAHIIFLSMGD